MPTVLVTEDSMFLRIANQRILTRAGYDVITATDGPEALQMARDQHPDLVLLDMMLPRLSGQSVLQKLKADPGTAAIPVVILSSLSQVNAEKLRAAGAAAFLEKGQILDNPRPLLQAIESALRKASERKTAAKPANPQLRPQLEQL